VKGRCEPGKKSGGGGAEKGDTETKAMTNETQGKKVITPAKERKERTIRGKGLSLGRTWGQRKWISGKGRGGGFLLGIFSV